VSDVACREVDSPLDPHDHRRYMRASNPSAILNRDGKQEYIGALPPGPAPPEGDWFTRLPQL